MPYRVYIVDPPTLLDDLLEDSDRLFHHHSAVIQRIFHDQWLTTLGENIGEEQIQFPDDAAAQVEARVRDRLRGCRAALQQKQRELIHEEEQIRTVRDQAIRAYVASRPGQESTVAA